MTYNPNIPAASHTPAQDQPLMQQNFQQIGVSYNTDHIPLTSGVNVGFSNKTTLVSQTTDPGPFAGNGILYTKTVNALVELFYRNPTGIEQLTTGTPVAANTGQSSLPGGIIIKWGRQVGNNSTAVPVTITPAFPLANFVVFVTSIYGTGPGGSTNIFANAVDSIMPGAFTVRFPSNFLNTWFFSWLAIGN